MYMENHKSRKRNLIDEGIVSRCSLTFHDLLIKLYRIVDSNHRALQILYQQVNVKNLLNKLFLIVYEP